MTSHYRFIADETALERDLSESCAEIARLKNELAELRAREARVRLFCKYVNMALTDEVLAFLDGKDGEG